jgi:hypothetical protein
MNGFLTAGEEMTQTIDKTTINDSRENETKKIGFGIPVVIWD